MEKKFMVNGVSFNMIHVEVGTFVMGTQEEWCEGNADEHPSHRVTLDSFYIAETEVTQELWEAVMGDNPSSTKSLHHPVESVTWDDCQAFISELNALTGKTFRLPTEAEWEYAARGGSKSKGYKYSGSDDLNEVGWYWGNYDISTHDVATKKPNELGIYDMSGNVYEWCQDWYGDYSPQPQTNPQGSSEGIIPCVSWWLSVLSWMLLSCIRTRSDRTIRIQELYRFAPCFVSGVNKCSVMEVNNDDL